MTTEDKIIYFVNPGIKIAGIILGIIGLLFMVITLGIFIGISERPFFDTSGEIGLMLPFWIPTATGFIMFLISAIIMFVGYRKKQKLKNLMHNGTLTDATVISNVQNFHIRINNIPQRIVQFKAQGSTYEFRFFSEELAQLFQLQRKFKIRCNAKGEALPDAKCIEQFIQ